MLEKVDRHLNNVRILLTLISAVSSNYTLLASH